MFFSQWVLGFLLGRPVASPCPQWDALYPLDHAALDAELENTYASQEFKLRTYDALAAAIRIPTVSHDANGPVGEDPVWNVFGDLHAYLEHTFPLVYDKLKVTKVNTYGLVFHWQGSTDAKPILLAAHQDVVPVEPSTVSEWKYPPFSGQYDGTWIWGRGTCDDKTDLIERLVTIDTLLKLGFSPTRTVVVAFGFDEEVTGQQGAGHIATYLEETYGRDGFTMILDEGGGAQTSNFGNGLYIAFPGLSEKGYMDVRMEVSSPGGHSSLPPDHTSIGLLAQAIVTIEGNPHVPQLLRDGTPFTNVQCQAKYSPDFPDSLRSLARKAITDDTALSELTTELAKLSPKFRALMSTTQAVDVISGGVKINALPERASVLVNQRIAEHSSIAKLEQHYIDILSPVAALHNLTFKAFGKTISTGGSGELVVAANSDPLEPSPVTPIEPGPYSILDGTYKATMLTSKLYNVTNPIMAPSLMLANTDTEYYWNLTKHIFRYALVTQDDCYNGIHTVNEAVRAESVIEGIRFLTKLILNMDESHLP